VVLLPKHKHHKHHKNRMTAYQFGPGRFRRGLMHVIRRQVEFDHIATKEHQPLTWMVWDMFKDREALTNEMNDLLEKAVRAKI
jgi:hypothetical protein